MSSPPRFAISIGLAAACVVTVLVLRNYASAANPEPVTAQVTFVDRITITEISALQYGLLDTAFANTETIIIATNSGVSGTGTGRILGGTRAATDLTVTATAGQSITILVDTIVSGSGYALGTFVCSYNGGANTACGAPGYSATSVANATLLIGATLTGDGTAVAGAADGSFNMTVSYQ